MNKISWLLFQWYFIIVKPSPTPGITVVLQKLSFGNFYNITCILSGENLNSGIAWYQEHYNEEESRVSKYVPTYYEELNCKMKKFESCTSTWTKGYWTIQNSYLTSLDVVTDNRWEEFEVIYTESYQLHHSVRFDSDDKNKLTINFSIRAENQADIFLCTSRNPYSSECYWILLNARQASIRKCSQYELRYFSIESTTCSTSKSNMTTLQYEILSIDSWKHFTIAINKNNVILKLSTNNNTLLQYTDNENEYIRVHDLLIRSLKTAYWKIHTYEFSWTTITMNEHLGPRIKIQDNKFCISLYIAMCSECSLIIRALHGNSIIATKTVKAIKEFKWQNVKWNILLPTTILEVLLYFETQCVDNNCDEQFWAFDDFRICTKDEVRVLTVRESPLKLSALQIVEGPSKNFKLENLVLPTKSDVHIPDPTCPIGTIGSTTCTNCSQIFGHHSSYCQASIICDYSIHEEGICRCSPGYTGINCRNKCSFPNYGDGCQEKCGLCEFTDCNYINGFCTGSEKCLSNFVWPQCKIPPYPVLTNSSIIIDSGYTQISIQISNFSYHGLGLPTKYKVRYRFTENNNNSWYETGSYPILDRNLNITLSNLSSDTSYTIRVVLLTSADEFYNGTYSVQKIVANTTCSDVQEEDVIVTTTNSTAILRFSNNPELCPIKNYEIRFIKFLLAANNNAFHIANLVPYTNYTVTITNLKKPTYKLCYNFKTQGALNAATFVVYEESIDTLRLRITPPYLPTGELEQYFVKYCEVASCKDQVSACEEKYFEAIPCKIWAKYHCLDISEKLKGGKLYRIFVQARNKNIEDMGSEMHDCKRTAETNLTAPEELKASWDNYYNLTLQWKHPDITNGSLTKFGITIYKINNECYRSDYMVSEETTRLTYNYTISIYNRYCYTSKLTVRIQSYNEKAGGTAILEIYSPPQAPTLNAFVENFSNTTITIALSGVKLQPPGLFLKRYMYVVLSESKSKFEIGNNENALNKLENLESFLPSWHIAKYTLTTEILKEKLTFGSNNNSNNLLQNDVSSSEIKLIPNTSYTITILIYNEYQDRKRYRVYEIVTSTSAPLTNHSSDNSFNNALFSIILLVLILPLWIYYRKRKSGKWCSSVDTRRDILIPNVKNNHNVILLKQILEISPSQLMDPDVQISPKHTTNNLNKINDDINNSKFSKVVNVTNFDKYVKKAIVTGELERQHLSFVRVQEKPLDDGYVTPNEFINDDQAENEYEEIDLEEYADDIRATYIEGYISKSAYVATKFPKIAAINNFWKLIWQDNVQYIVLLSSVTEGEKQKKDKQFWPKINASRQFANIFVKCISVQTFIDYEYRTFMVSSNNIERQVQQLHFTSWPNHGVPIYPQTLVPLFQVLSTIPESNSPIVVHCSVGMQPIGTTILCDLCLKMAAHEGVMDILKYQRKLRTQKANLIGSFEQYKLVHLVLLECLRNSDSIPCDEEAVNNILSLLETTTVENQFRYITEVAWQDQAMKPLLQITEEPAWKKKNRFQNILASGHGRVYLSLYPETDKHSNYINAVEVDGFKSPKRFIVTQQPLPNTISDFWRMVDEKRVSTVVSLNTISKKNDRACVFWPTFAINEIRPVPYLLIKFINKVRKEEITILNLELHCNRNKDYFKRNICLIKLKNWPADQLMPNSNASLLKLWHEAEKLSQPDQPIVLTCYDGVTACGLFAAFTFVIEKIKLEHQCDVCLAVRTVRRNREQFVNKLEQFKYLYLAVVSYLTDFRLYANVSSLQQYKNNI